MKPGIKRNVKENVHLESYIARQAHQLENIDRLRVPRQLSGIAKAPRLSSNQIAFRNAKPDQKLLAQLKYHETHSNSIPLADPLLIGKYPIHADDSTQWKHDMKATAEQEKTLDYIPFGVTLVLGRIESGKTNLAAHIATLASHYYQYITVVTGTKSRDPTWSTVAFECSPLCHFDIVTEMPFHVILKDQLNVERDLHAQMSKLSRGGTKDPQVDEATLNLKPHRSASYPLRDPQGNSYNDVAKYHMRDIILPTAIDSVKQTIPLLTNETVLKLDDALLTRTGIMLKNRLNPLETTRQMISDRQLQTTRDGVTTFKDELYRSRLFIIDDPAEFLTNSRSVIEWIMALRHNRHAAFILAQRLPLVPLAIRTQVSELIIYRVDNFKEYERIKEEFGHSVQNFDEAYKTCMEITPECSNPFMCIRFKKGIVQITRNFTHEIAINSV